MVKLFIFFIICYNVNIKGVYFLRIIAGTNKGVVLKTFEAENIRPTIDRVKESVFNKLQFEIKNSVVLDLFAGTGNLGLEALSRGAKMVYACDQNKTSIKIIKENYAKCKQPLNLFEGDFCNALKMYATKKMQFDLIFLDPPYASDCGIKSLEFINKFNLLKSNGTIVFEHTNNIDLTQLNIKNLVVADERTYGTVYVTFLTRNLNENN